MTRLNATLAGLSLNVGTPGQTKMILQQPRPAAPMFMNVPVDEIDFFGLNPRRLHDDEEYRNIKESIRATGIQQPVHVTQKPEAQRYVLAQGGNTRLKIMKELWAETNDEKFRLMPCFFIPYTNDTDLQIAHLVENEQRAEMCFWDKACAYSDIRQIFLKEQDSQKLSLREAEVLFCSRGLSVSHALLGMFFFAKEYLSSLGRAAFKLSVAKTTAIRKTYTHLQDISKQNGQSERFVRFWPETLQNWGSQYADGRDWDSDELIRHLKTVFQETFEMTVSNKRLSEKCPNKRNQSTETAKQAKSADLPDGDMPIPKHPAGTASLAVDPPLKTQDEGNCGSSLEELQRHLHKLVKRWLGMVQLADCFRAHQGFSYGFYVEYPAFENIRKPENVYFVIDALHSEAGNVFTYLAKLSGQEEWLYDLDNDAANPILNLPVSSKLRIAYQEPDKMDEYNNIGIGDKSNLISQVLAWQTDTRYSEFAQIIDDILSAVRLMKQIVQKGTHHA